MVTHALAPILETPPVPGVLRHYRMANAAFGIVGLESSLGAGARELANRLAGAGTRLGVITLWSEMATGVEEELITLLAPLSRVTIIEPASKGGVLFRRLARGLSEPWHPRLFHVTHAGQLGRSHLMTAVDGMLNYGDEEIRFGTN